MHLCFQTKACQRRRGNYLHDSTMAFVERRGCEAKSLPGAIFGQGKLPIIFLCKKFLGLLF